MMSRDVQGPIQALAGDRPLGSQPPIDQCGLSARSVLDFACLRIVVGVIATKAQRRDADCIPSNDLSPKYSPVLGIENR